MGGKRINKMNPVTSKKQEQYVQKQIKKSLNDIINDLEMEQYMNDRYLYEFQRDLLFAKDHPYMKTPRCLEVLEIYKCFD